MWLRQWESKVLADYHLKLFTRDIRPFDYDFFSYHNGWRDRQVKFKILIGFVLLVAWIWFRFQSFSSIAKSGLLWE